MTTENVKSGTFDYPHDLDTFRVDMVTGQRYLFSLKGTGTSPATSMGLQVLNSKGELQVFDFEIGAGGEAKLSFVSPTTDPYYVMVGNIDPATQGIEAGLGSYELTANTLSLDDHADLKADGTALAAGVTKAGAFDQPHDFDYFKIDLFAGQRYLFEMKGAGADPLETMEMLLLGSNGERVEFDVSSGVSAKSQISYVPVSSATYYLLASNDHFTDFGFTDGIGTYQVSVSSLALDDYGDLLPQAALLLPGQPRTGAFDVTDDLDYFKYDMRAGQRYVIDMTWLGNNTGGGTELRVYDPAGKEVIYDLRATGEPSSQIAFQAALDGYYYLRASNTDVSDTGLSAAIGQYRMGVTLISQDDGPDYAAQALPLTVGATQAGAFDQPHDRDHYKINLTAGTRYTFGVNGAGSNPLQMVELQLLDPTGALVVEDLGLTAAGGAQASFVAPETGSYIVLATNDTLDLFGSTTVLGGYEITVSGVANDLEPDLKSAATVFPVGSLQEGSHDLPFDNDYFKMELVAGQRYLVDMAGVGRTPLKAPGFQIFDAAGVLREQDQSSVVDARAQLVFTAPATGSYYLLATNAMADAMGAAATTGNYQITLQPVGADDHSDRFAGATLLVPLADTTIGVLLNGTAGADVLTGGIGNDTLYGMGGRDRLTGGAGNDVINGGDDLDKAVFEGVRANYTLTRGATGWTVTDKTGASGVDTVSSVERFVFSNVGVALDLDGNAGTTARILRAVFGSSYLGVKEFVGIGLSLLDSGTSYQDLVGMAVATDVFANLAGSRSNTDFVKLVYRNVIGVAPSASELGYFVGLLDSGVYSQASLAYMACEVPQNTQSAELVGLAATGIEYLPGG